MKRVSYSLLAGLLVLSPQSATAQDGVVCRTVEHCRDILSRHTSAEFDYAVLAAEFSRFGPSGEQALMDMARSDQPLRLFDLAARPTASPRLKSAVMGLWPAPDPDAFTALARSMPAAPVRARALSTLNADDPALRAASRKLLSLHSDPWPDIGNAYPSLAQSMSREPSVELVTWLARMPGDHPVPALQGALSSGNAEIITTAFLALERRNPARAAADLKQAFLSASPQTAGAWTSAFTQINQRSESLDLVASGHEWLTETSLRNDQRAVGLHLALMAPATPTRQVMGNRSGLLPELLKLPISDRLAETAPTHPLFAERRALEQLLSVWQGQDTENVARFARAIGRAKPDGARAILQNLYARTSDYRVQIAIIEALSGMGEGARDWIETATRAHPIHRVQQAGAAATGTAVHRPDAACLGAETAYQPRPERLPYFSSGQDLEGTPLGRWQLRDAHRLPGGWLAAYDTALIRYTSNDRATRIDGILGEPIAILPASPTPPAQRQSRFYILSAAPDLSRLYVYDAKTGLQTPRTLPAGARAAEAANDGEWLLDFPGPQPTLRLTREGALVSVCAPPPGARPDAVRP